MCLVLRLSAFLCLLLYVSDNQMFLAVVQCDVYYLPLYAETHKIADEILKHTIMTRLYRFFAAAVLSIALCPSLSATSDKDKEKVDIDKSDVLIAIDGEDIIRSLPVLEVYIDGSQSVLEILHSGIGYTEIFILDATGNPVDYACADSSFSNMTVMPLPSAAGVYQIVIMSGRYYAEGYFRIC